MNIFSDAEPQKTCVCDVDELCFSVFTVPVLFVIFCFNLYYKIQYCNVMILNLAFTLFNCFFVCLIFCLVVK